jgi:dihydrofolate reductase
MRKIVAGLFVALDGVMEAPEKWHFPYYNDQMGHAVGAQMAAADTLLLGRRTYQEFATHWPHQGTDVPFAAYMNDIPKLVVSTTLQTLEWQNSTLIRGDVAQELRRLKQEPGKGILINGSATLVRSLLRDRLLDELQLLVHPIVVGTGMRLFEEEGGSATLQLLDAKTFRTGVLHLTYAPTRTWPDRARIGAVRLYEAAGARVAGEPVEVRDDNFR